LVTGLIGDVNDLDVLLVRYNSNGTLDTTFGTGGVVVYDGGVSENGGDNIAPEADGQILVVSTTGPGDALLLRFNTNGSPDSTFGVNGVVTFNGGFSDSARGVAVSPNGSIVIAGASFNAMAQGLLLIARYNANGTLDTSFGGDGVITPVPGT